MTERYEDEAWEKAEFCVALRMAPSEYDGLTMYEREAFVEVHNEKVKRENSR